MFLSISESDLSVHAELGQESQASSCVEELNSSCLSSCSRGDKPLVDLYVNLRAFPTMHEGVRPLRFVPSFTGLPSKRQKQKTLQIVKIEFSLHKLLFW